MGANQQLDAADMVMDLLSTEGSSLRSVIDMGAGGRMVLEVKAGTQPITESDRCFVLDVLAICCELRRKVEARVAAQAQENDRG